MDVQSLTLSELVVPLDSPLNCFHCSVSWRIGLLLSLVLGHLRLLLAVLLQADGTLATWRTRIALV